MSVNQALRTKLKEGEHPVGVKRTSNWHLPPKDFAYGKQIPPDKEGVSIITRSWRTHDRSSTSQPPQDFVKINKLAIRMNATAYDTHKDFRKHVDIRRPLREGKKGKLINLPENEFVYGIRNRTPTPIKKVINNEYGNAAETVIRQEYKTFMRENEIVAHFAPRTTPHFMKLLQARKMNQNIEEKPLYKMRMFKRVPSKVAEGIRQFKTFYPRGNGGIDKMINKVQEELKVAEQAEAAKAGGNMGTPMMNP